MSARTMHRRALRAAWDRALGRGDAGEVRGALVAHGDSCPDCAGGATSPDGVIVAVRRLVHGDPSVATGVERRLLLETVLGRLTPPPRPVARAWGLLPAAAAALLLLLLLPRDVQEPAWAPGERSAARGAVRKLPPAGLGISGVDPMGSEYEVVHGEGICPVDTLRFYVTVRDRETPYLAILGVQDPGDPTWYLPVAGDEPWAVPELPRRLWMVPLEVEVGVAHRPGPLSVVAILSSEPISFEPLAAAWAAARGAAPRQRAEDAAARLGAGITRVLLEELSILDGCGRRP
ncbi:MAG: hypothetical protein FJ098_07235 [Deltaproteobacteria bacterium]|nr:hypothetical protein [Deltaproteobacteria bacterium]